MRDGCGFDRWPLAKAKLLQRRVSSPTSTAQKSIVSCLEVSVVSRVAVALWQAGLEGRKRGSE